MSVQVEVREFVGEYAGLNSRRTALPVGMAELVNKAITVGGLVAGSPRQRTFRRSGIAGTVLSSVQPVRHRSGKLAMTELFRNAESTEKAGTSFRLGMALAAAVVGRVLGTNQLAHIPLGSGGGRRADLLGIDRNRQRHLVEAKGRSHGIPGALKGEAKDQARASRATLEAKGFQVATASASLADLTEDVSVLLVDPPDSEGGRAGFRFSEGAFLSNYYSPVADLLEARDSVPSGVPDVDDVAVGSWLPGGLIWLGLSRRIWEVRSDPDHVLGETENLDDRQAADSSPLVHVASDGHAVVLAAEAIEPQPNG